MTRFVKSIEEYNLDPKLQQNLDIGLNGVIHYKQDFLILVDGDEGSGKSQTMRTVGFYCASKLGTTFDREGTGNIHSSMDKYISVAEAKSKEGVVGFVNILDEARAVLGKAHHNNREIKQFTDWLSECREMKQVHLVALPAFHDIHKYVALWRMVLLIHMKKEYRENPEALGGYDLVLGSFKMYANDTALQQCYFIPYTYPSHWDAFNRMPNVEVMTPAGLEAVKAQKDAERLKRAQRYSESGVDKASIHRDAIVAIMTRQGHSVKTFKEMLKVSDTAVRDWIKTGKLTTFYADFFKTEEVSNEEA